MATHYDLAGRRAVVTGAASGIGAAVAERLRTSGADVLGVDRAPGCDLTLDVTAPDSATRIAAAAGPRLDILVACAGVSGFTPLDDHPDALWDDTLAVNLTSVFRLARACAPLLRASGRGRIVTIGSVMSAYGDAGMAAYAASKHGVLGLTRSLATELGPDGVTANCILPGAVRTGITAPAFAAMPAFEAMWREKAAVRRIAEPDEIAGLAAFLCTDDAGFISGHGIFADGGAMAHP